MSISVAPQPFDVEHGDAALLDPQQSRRLQHVQCLGGIPVPLYQDAVAAEMAFPIQNAEITHALFEVGGQYRRSM